MARWSLYGVFLPGNKWAMTTSKKKALAFAKEHAGYVTRMPYAGSPSVWDAPTFRVCSEMLADFRACQQPLRVDADHYTQAEV